MQYIEEQRWIRFRRSINEWCMRNAEKAFAKKRLEHSLRWSFVAAYIAGLDCCKLVDERIEANLLKIAHHIPVPEVKPFRVGENRRRWLHVLTGAYPYGGHTAMIWRWIEKDSARTCHSVIILNQDGMPVPDRLVAAVRNGGGTVSVLDSKMSLLQKAYELRKHAYANADAVILSIAEHDVVPSVAFGLCGGPSVMLVNMVAHIAWIGASTTDIVLNVRGSDKEIEWTRKFRGIDPARFTTLPLPLESKEKGSQDRISKTAARSRLGLPKEAKVALTIGNTHKYTPIKGADFISAAQRIVDGISKAYVIAVGVEETAEWKKARENSNGRVIAVGRHLDLRPYHTSADIYIEGYPFGSTTAMFEAGLAGLPCILAPNTCPPPFTTDGLAVDHLPRPKDENEYVQKARSLLMDSKSRTDSFIKDHIEKYHDGEGWMGFVQALRDKLASDHVTYKLQKVAEVPVEYSSLWSSFSRAIDPEDSLLKAFRLATAMELKPSFDSELNLAALAIADIRKANPLLLAAVSMASKVNSYKTIAINKERVNSLYYYLRDDGLILRTLTGLKKEKVGI